MNCKIKKRVSVIKLDKYEWLKKQKVKKKVGENLKVLEKRFQITNDPERRTYLEHLLFVKVKNKIL